MIARFKIRVTRFKANFQSKTTVAKFKPMVARFKPEGYQTQRKGPIPNRGCQIQIKDPNWEHNNFSKNLILWPYSNPGLQFLRRMRCPLYHVTTAVVKVMLFCTYI
jgi:hypothetical protein